MACGSKGAIIILSGPADKSIRLIKKMNLEVNEIEDLTITSVLITSRSTAQMLDLALCTSNGLFFATLEFQMLGRSMQFKATLN